MSPPPMPYGDGDGDGADEVEIMRHGRWRSATTMRGQLEEGTRFRATHPVHCLALTARRRRRPDESSRVSNPARSLGPAADRLP